MLCWPHPAPLPTRWAASTRAPTPPVPPPCLAAHGSSCLLYTSPYGTKLYITSTDGKFVYGYAVATDTGIAVQKGQILDVYKRQVTA